MGYFTTLRRKLETPEPGNTPAITGDLKKLAEQLDRDVEALEGTHAGRPAAGSAGRLYRETDTGQLLHDTGTVWEGIPTVLGGGVGARMSWGTVSSAGAIEQAGSGDWTVTKTGEGTYKITWNPAHKVSPNVVFFQMVTHNADAVWTTRSEGELQYSTFNAAGAPANLVCSFFVISAG
jgi:hypothetical protein